MKRDVQAVVLIFLGSALLRISFTDIYLRYVKDGMRPFLLASCSVISALAWLPEWASLIVPADRSRWAARELCPKVGDGEIRRL